MPTTNPPDSTTEAMVTIKVQYDAYPSEFGWKLVDTRTKTTLVKYLPGSVTTPFEYLSVTMQLVRGRKYRFVMNDGFGDGMCCNYGNGYVGVRQGNEWLASNTTESMGYSSKLVFTPK